MSNCPSQKQPTHPILTIDLKKRRIRLYKSVLRLLDDPEYIQFLINPEKHVFIIRRCTEHDINSQKIYWSMLNNNHQSCEFYSKPFVEALKRLHFKKTDIHSYRIQGQYMDHQKIFVFNMDNSEPILYESEA